MILQTLHCSLLQAVSGALVRMLKRYAHDDMTWYHGVYSMYEMRIMPYGATVRQKPLCGSKNNYLG